MTTPDNQALRKSVREKVNDAFQYGEQGVTDIDTVNAALNLTTDQILALLSQEIVKAEERGRQVGQYQVADKLYGDITHIYLFRGGDNKATAIADESATELLKDCENFLNHNAKAYKAYLVALQNQAEEGK